LVMFGKSEPGQYAQRSRSFRERELRRYGDFRLRVLRPGAKIIESSCV